MAPCARARAGRAACGAWHAAGYLPGADHAAAQRRRCEDLVERARGRRCRRPAVRAGARLPDQRRQRAAARTATSRSASSSCGPAAIPSHAPHANFSLNLEQDLAAIARGCWTAACRWSTCPGFHVGAQLRLSLPEVER
ncbi:MAG: hypothetical protein MZW92_49005 [Comamonadaceae bacterium]|nr:hypothetical protein [Comamonadaceae bacterium]